MATGTIPANADYIIATGQSTADGETWYWEKYKSGLLTAKATITHTSNTYSAWGNGYYSVLPAKSLPSGLFTSVYGMQATVVGSAAGNDCWLGSPAAASPSPNLTTANVPNLMALRFTNISGARNTTVCYLVTGRWD